MFKNEVFSQAEARSVDIWLDQWNRPWEVTIDHRSRKYAWVAAPIPRFKVPHFALYPDQKYVTNGGMGKVRIDTDTMLEDVRRSQKLYSELLMQVIQHNFPSNALEVAQNPPPSVIQMLGSRPYPEEFVRAMRAGNAWALGFSEEEPKWLTPALKAWLAAKTGGVDLVTEALRDAEFADETPISFTPAKPSMDPEDEKFADAPVRPVATKTKRAVATA